MTGEQSKRFLDMLDPEQDSIIIRRNFNRPDCMERSYHVGIDGAFCFALGSPNALSVAFVLFKIVNLLSLVCWFHLPSPCRL